MSALKTNSIICGIFCLFILFSCQQEKPTLSSLFTPLSARAQYEQRLKRDTLFDKNRLSVWDSIGNLAFSHNVAIPTPFRQSGHFLKGRAEVLAFEIPLKKGEIIDLQLNSDSTNIEIFMDFFRKKRGRWYPIFKNKKGQTSFKYEIPASETFLLRIQPEFQENANYELKILKNPLYTFPVAGKGNEDVWSFWGDPRGGGKRKHKGIDIFARRGTPLIAVCKGYVSNVSDKGLGGKQVWIRDVKNKNMLYYAHLHKQLVKERTNGTKRGYYRLSGEYWKCQELLDLIFILAFIYPEGVPLILCLMSKHTKIVF